MIKLVTDTISKEDIKNLCNWLSQEITPQLTKGNLTKEFEKKWSEKIGTKHSVFVNSGSSAILLTLSALKQGDYLKNNKVVVSGLSWHTDVSSPMLLGMDVILSDCNLEDLSCDLNHLEEIFEKENPSVLILVSVLGLVPKMDEISKLCEKYNVILLEDVCESAGSKFKNTNLGTFGLASFFSFYYGHHLSTIEGGFINTSDKKLNNILLSIRNHGWDRDLDEEERQNLRKTWNIKEFDSLYKFYYEGFNCRSTDLQAFIGLNQISKLDNFSNIRNNNYNLYNSLVVNNILNFKQELNFVSNFAYPVVTKDRERIVQKLIENKIEVRPLIAGSMANQPFWIKKNGIKELKNCNLIDKYGFYVPNNQTISITEIEKICDIINN